jgi:indole-3-glycerol phosphate synthase
VLEALTAGALDDAAIRRESVSFAEIERRALATNPPLDAYNALSPAAHIRVIAEIKRASPSKGDLADISDAPSLAAEYVAGGADVISVLTEQRRFGGSLEDLSSIRERISTPILRKDFIAEEYQILEARAHGADLVLLIVAALDSSVLARLAEFAHQLDLAVLVETHSADEVRLAADIGSRLIGVNARDLSTFEIDRNLFADVRTLIPQGTTAVAESAVHTVDDVQNYRNAGADVVLIGEALVTSADPRQTVQRFREVA